MARIFFRCLAFYYNEDLPKSITIVTVGSNFGKRLNKPSKNLPLPKFSHIWSHCLGIRVTSRLEQKLPSVFARFITLSKYLAKKTSLWALKSRPIWSHCLGMHLSSLTNTWVVLTFNFVKVLTCT